MRTKTIFESANVEVDDKFGVQERILDNNFDEEANPKLNQENIELFYETNNDL